MLLGGPSPPSVLVTYPFNWSPNTVFYRYLSIGRSNKKKQKKTKSIYFLDTQVSLEPTSVGKSVGQSVGWSHFWISNLWSALLSAFSKSVFIFKCIFPKCIYPKCIFARCTRLACLLSFASLFQWQLAISKHHYNLRSLLDLNWGRMFSFCYKLFASLRLSCLVED